MEREELMHYVKEARVGFTLTSMHNTKFCIHAKLDTIKC